MKRTKKFLVGLLATLSVLSGSLGLAGCDETYTTTETDTLIAELEAMIEANKTELDGKITALTQAYQAKDNELLEKIEANEQSLAELKTAYEAKMTEIDELIDTLQNTDATQNEKITELVNKITALKEATRITGIAFAENGDLLVTFGDGSTQTVKAPEQHVHTFGEWTNFTTDDVPCENRLFFRVCTDCNAIEWKQGAYSDHDFTTVTTDPTCQAHGFDTKTCEICRKVETVNPTPIADHAWATKYSFDNSYHWIDCDTCDEFKNKEEHTVLSSGECSVCKELVGATEGVVYDVSNGEAQVVMYEGTATRVRIAETYQGAPVTKIGNEAFKNSAITSIVIPDSVTSIGDWAFDNCSSLTSLIIPDSVTSIGDYAFYDCESLKSVVIGDSVTSIGEYAFYGCGDLTSVTIGDSVTSIGEYAFEYCGSLTSMVIPDSVTSIGDYAFCHCDSLASIEIPDSVTSIGSCAFYGCDSLTSIVIGDSVTSIGSCAFAGCSNLQFNEYGNAKYLGSKTNGYFALIEAKSKNFSSYTIHNDTKIIAGRAFAWCGSLTSITIPDSVTSIGDYAFAYCSSLTSVTFEDTSTWYRTYNYTDWQNKTGGTQRDVSNPSDNASYFVNNYTSYWYKL